MLSNHYQHIVPVDSDNCSAHTMGFNGNWLRVCFSTRHAEGVTLVSLEDMLCATVEVDGPIFRRLKLTNNAPVALPLPAGTYSVNLISAG